MTETIQYYTYNEISELLHKYIPDISYYNRSFIERRFNQICEKLHIPSIVAFKEKIENDITFLDFFLFNLTVPITEMFRDSSMWKYINEHVLPELTTKKTYNIWFPSLSSGEELYSFCILLKHFNTENVTIYASHRSIYAIELIKKGIYQIKNENLNNLNYSKIGLGNNLDSFYTKSFNTLYMNASLLSHVKFLYSTSILQQIPDNLDLVIFRNTLLYYDKQMHHIILSEVYKHMNKSGFLILGLQDNNSIPNFNEMFKPENLIERIYRKK